MQKYHSFFLSSICLVLEYLVIALLQIFEDRYAKRAVIITSQLPVVKWHEYINQATVADAIMDRVTARAHRIELKGESRRKKKYISENTPS